MSKKKVKNLRLNIPQMIIALAPQREKYLEWGRGAGKSTILGWEMIERVKAMPRSTNSLVGATFQQILTRTLPSTIEGLEILGYKKDVHYTIGKRFKEALEPRQPPQKYNHFIHFWNGAGFHLISQDRDGHGRGLNVCSVIGDEAALLDKEKLDNDVLSTNRSGRRYYPDTKYLNSITFASTIPLTQQGRWMYKMEELARRYPDKILYTRASAMHNKDNLSKEWFEERERSMTPELFRIEILNIRPDKITETFYPALNPTIHYYTEFDYNHYDIDNPNFSPDSITCLGDADVLKDEGLIIGMDWGARINSMVICQRTKDSIKVLNNFWVLSPRIIDDLIRDEFVPYYEPHQQKHIKLYYDRNGNSRVANSNMTFAEQAKKVLEQYGWTVTLMSRGLDPRHSEKFALWSIVLREEDKRLPKFRINKHNARETVISMENAPAKEGSLGIQKDKRSERSKVIPQEEATHLSDALDTVVVAICKPILDRKTDLSPVTTN